MCQSCVRESFVLAHLKFWSVFVTLFQLRVLPTVEILNIRQKCETKAYLTGRRFLSVSGRVKRTLVPG